MRFRSFLLALGCIFYVSGVVFGQELGRFDQLQRDYLAETVRHNLPSDPMPGDGVEESVPRWALLGRDLTEARSLEPGADTEYLGALIAAQEGDRALASKILRDRWPNPSTSVIRLARWGNSCFLLWEPGPEEKEWIEAWLAWTGKVYQPQSLVRGIEVLEKSDPGAVGPLLSQAVELYPEDRRFLGLVARHPEVVSDASGLLAMDRAANQGLAPAELRKILVRKPDAEALFLQAGYTTAEINTALVRDYGSWLARAPKKGPDDGEWAWDSGKNNWADSRLIFLAGNLVTWTKITGNGGIWTLGFKDGKPESVTETRGGSRWTLRFETYPYARSLDYQWGSQIISFRFRPLAQPVPLWPPERFNGPSYLLPAVLADLWIPLEPRALVQKAFTVETSVNGLLTNKVYLYHGEVWLSEEDSRRSGRIDTWSYFLNGKLVSVYHDTEGTGIEDLKEIYHKGVLTQVQSKAAKGKSVEFVLFPLEGVQIWDPHGDRRPLQRLFFWEGIDKLNALVFTGQKLPWETMPNWEPRP